MSQITMLRRPPHLSVVEEESTAKVKLGYPINVIACWSGSGSPGRTTVAVNLATELALQGQKVLLVDLDTLGPAIALSLGLLDTPAGLSALLRLVEQGRLSTSEFKRLTVVVELGRAELIFMPGLSSPKRWNEVTPERFEAMLLAVSDYVDHVVLDLPQASYASSGLGHPSSPSLHRDDLLQDILRRCSKLVTVSGCDPVGAKRFLEAQEYLNDLIRDGEQFVVINRFRKSALGPDAASELSHSYESLAKLRIDCFIPEDSENLDKAMRNGLPLALLKRSSPARVAIAELARILIPTRANKRHRG